MYPKNSASPPRIAIGPVLQISDGAVQTSGVSVVVRPEGGSEGAGGGTISYGGTSNVVYYTPNQAETNYTTFVVTAYKTGCIPVPQTVVTSAESTSGKVSLGPVQTTDITGDLSGSVGSLVGHTNQTGDSFARIGALGIGLTAVSLAATGLDAITSTATGMIEIAKAIWDRVVTSGNHNIQNSAGKIIRELKESPGYEGGFIYYDSIDGEAGDEPHVNGTFDKPVNNETDLLALKVALKANQVNIKPGSTLPFTTAHEKQSYIGEAWTLVLGNQNVSASFFHGATDVSGIGTGAIPIKFCDCIIKDVTMAPSSYHKCGFAGNFIVGSAGNFFFVGDSHSAVAGVGTPSFDYGAAIGATNFNFRGYHGGIEIKNMKAEDRLSFDGDGQFVINASCTGGTIRIAGHQKITGRDAFVLAGGIIEDSARFATDQLQPNGARQITLQIYETATAIPISDASITIWNSDETLVIGRKITDVNGQWIVDLDDGTYILRFIKAGVVFTSSEILTVSATPPSPYYGTPLVIAPPADPSGCRVYDYLFLPDSVTPVPAVDIDAVAKIQIIPFNAGGKLHAGSIISYTYNISNGLIYWDIAQGAEVHFDVKDLISTSKIIPSTPTARLVEIV